jgi:hypothetical protein
MDIPPDEIEHGAEQEHEHYGLSDSTGPRHEATSVFTLNFPKHEKI